MGGPHADGWLGKGEGERARWMDKTRRKTDTYISKYVYLNRFWVSFKVVLEFFSCSWKKGILEICDFHGAVRIEYISFTEDAEQKQWFSGVHFSSVDIFSLAQRPLSYNAETWFSSYSTLLLCPTSQEPETCQRCSFKTGLPAFECLWTCNSCLGCVSEFSDFAMMACKLFAFLQPIPRREGAAQLCAPLHPWYPQCLCKCHMKPWVLS